MGKRRVRNLLWLGVEEIVGYDLRPDRREEAHQKYGIPTVETVDAGFDLEPDAAVISTPPDLHIPLAVQAASRGIHCFTEASVVDDGIESLRGILASRPGLVAFPSCTMRYFPGPRKVMGLLGEGAIGRPMSFVYQSGQYLPDWHPWEDYRSYYVSRRVTGACREILPFELTWLTQAFGPVTQVQGHAGKHSDLDADIDDLYQCLLGFSSGVRGMLQVDVLARTPTRHFVVLGTDGTIEWDSRKSEVRMFVASTRTWRVDSLDRGTVEKGYAEWAAEEPYVEEMRDFIAACLGHRPFGYTFEEDCRILEVLRAVEQSHGEGRRITLR
jgi:predicted dehydrogenase